MKELMIYLLKSGICLSLFWLVYRLFLRSGSFFRFNRCYLLFGLVASFLLPAIHPTYDVVVAPVAISEALPISVLLSPTVPASVPAPAGINPWAMLLCLYVAGMLFQIARNLKTYRQIGKIARLGISTRYADYTLVDSPGVDSPFTVLHRIYLNTRNLSETERRLILEHEKTHVTQKHWIDLIACELLLLVHWWNPVAWLYVLSQKENHEFLADRKVIDSGVPPTLYRAVLINRQFNGALFSCSN